MCKQFSSKWSYFPYLNQQQIMLKKTVMKPETEADQEKSSATKSRENIVVLTNLDRPKFSDCFNWTRVFTNCLEHCFHRWENFFISIFFHGINLHILFHEFFTLNFFLKFYVKVPRSDWYLGYISISFWKICVCCTEILT